MPMYVTLINWTSKGIEHIKESPGRLDKVKAAIKAAGGEAKAFYMTMGRYDGLLISEAPSDEAYARAVLTIASSGNISTQTLKAFSEEEYRRILGGI